MARDNFNDGFNLETLKETNILGTVVRAVGTAMLLPLRIVGDLVSGGVEAQATQSSTEELASQYIPFQD